MKRNSMSGNVSEWKSGLTGKTIAIATALVMVLSFGALGAYGAGEAGDNADTAVTTADPTAVVVAVQADQAVVQVISQTVQGTGLLVPIDTDLTFTVVPVESFAIADVSVNGQSYGAEPGTYTVPGAEVRDTLTISVATNPAEGVTMLAADSAQTPVVAKVDEVTYVYDGQPHVPILTLQDEAGNLVEGFYAISNSLPEFVNVTGGPQEVVCNDAVILNDAGEDVTAQFAITFVPGSINIEPATIRIVTPSATKVYDGAALTAADEAVLDVPGIDEIMEAVLPTFQITGSQTEIGESVNTYTMDWGSVDQSNYIVEEELGTLSVTQNEASIVISGPTLDKVYDGTPLQATEADYTAPEGFRIEATVEGSQTDVGSTASRVTEYRILDSDGTDITDSFADIQIQEGKLTVTPAELTITTPARTKAYDGTPLTASADNWVGGLVNDETVTAMLTGMQTEVGSSKNTYVIEWDGTAKETNYRVTESLGILEVTQPVAVNNAGSGAPASGSGSTGTGGSAATGGSGTTYTPSASSTPIAGTPGVNYLSESSTSEAASNTPGNAEGAVEAVAEGMQNAARGVIGEDPIPLTAPSVTELADDGTPLGAFDAPMNNWVRWYVVVGIIATALYGAGVLVRRRNFTRGLENQENSLLGVESETAEAAIPAADVVSVQ